MGSSAARAISWMSAPAENARSPVPVKMTALTSSSASMSLMASSSWLYTSRLRAFKTSGLFSLMVPTPSFFSTTRICSLMVLIFTY